MKTWTVYKYVKANGRCPIDEWRTSRKVTSNDQAALDSRIDTIEGFSDLPPEYVKRYKGTSLYELKVRANKKQLRPLCIVEHPKKIILLCGAIEKDQKIPKGDIQKAENLLSDYKNRLGHAKHYYED